MAWQGCKLGEYYSLVLVYLILILGKKEEKIHATTEEVTDITLVHVSVSGTTT